MLRQTMQHLFSQTSHRLFALTVRRVASSIVKVGYNALILGVAQGRGVGYWCKNEIDFFGSVMQ
jgi:hypothetical protein